MPADKTRPSFYILPPERLLLASALKTWLGRVVKSYSEPDANFVPADPTPFVTHPFVTSSISNASFSMLSQQNKSLAARLGASAIHASQDSKDGGGLSFTSSEVLCVRLQYQDGVFDRLNQHVETRAQLTRMLSRGGNTGFMVAAVLIWRDAAFTHSRDKEIETSAGIAVPLSAIITSVTGLTLPSDSVNPRLGGMKGGLQTVELSGESAGDHIFALQYKAVRRSVLQSFLGRGSNIALRDSSPELPSIYGLLRQGVDVDESSDEECDDAPGDGFNDVVDCSDDGMAEESSDDHHVILEIDQNDVTWAELLDQDEEGLECVDTVLDGGEVQFVFSQEQ